MLTELCAEIRNYFLGADPMRNIHPGSYTISGGSIAPLDFLKEGQYFRIVGSTFNDGVHQYPVADMTDETFTGAVWAMAVPPAVVALADKIKAYNASDAAKPSPFASESFGGYSYSKATDANGAPISWKTVFAKDMKQYRRSNVI
jgi:hypothetical protein